jgi:hypothetical protein
MVRYGGPAIAKAGISIAYHTQLSDVLNIFLFSDHHNDVGSPEPPELLVRHPSAHTATRVLSDPYSIKCGPVAR